MYEGCSFLLFFLRFGTCWDKVLIVFNFGFRVGRERQKMGMFAVFEEI